ncbi:MAG: energy transducer TonB [Bacteroidota bacterium]
MEKNIKYPKEAKKQNIQGQVLLQFVVNKDGSIEQIKVVKGIGGGCDEEAVRVLESSPK